MKTQMHCLGKSFGPVASFSGLVLLLAGLISLAQGAWVGGVLIPLGTFISFTRSCTHIDFDLKRVRSGDKLFGLFVNGRWQKLRTGMYLQVFHSDKLYRNYSRGNRVLDIVQKNNVIRLYDEQGRKVCDLMALKEGSDEEGQLSVMSERLGLISKKE
ncbi:MULTISPECIES: hypothetical protein [unclassified Carboxylicivirga]|uniref:hypothetical protein n=1 Tax=Carboxylicivirga TaxID=1628153 RepID=UPI003D346E24